MSTIKTKEDRQSLSLYLLIFIAYSVSYIGRKGYSACMNEISQTMELTKTFTGAISTGYLFCYGAGQFANGFLSDRTSPRLMIFIGLTGAGLCNLAMGLVGSPYLLPVAWCLNGLFNSMLWGSVIKALATWMPDRKRAKAGTNIAGTIPLGTIVAYLLSSLCLKYFRWEVTFFFSGGIVLLYSLIWMLGTRSLFGFIREMEAVHLPIHTLSKEKAKDESSQKKSGMSLFACILSTGLVFTILGVYCNGIIKDGVTEWIPTYITEYFSTTPSFASLLSVILPLVNLTGTYVAQWIQDRFTHNEMSTSAILFGFCALSITGLFFLGKYNMILSVVLIALSTASMLGVNNMMLTMIPMHFASVGRSASVAGFIGCNGYIAAAISSVVIGIIAQNKGWDATILFWLLTAAVGTLICFVGAPVWKKGQLTLRGKED